MKYPKPKPNYKDKEMKAEIKILRAEIEEIENEIETIHKENNRRNKVLTQITESNKEMDEKGRILKESLKQEREECK